MSKRCFGYVRPAIGEDADVQSQAIRDYFRTKIEPQGYSFFGIFADAPDAAPVSWLTRPCGIGVSAQARPGDVLLVADSAKAFAGLRDLLRTAGVLNGEGVELRLLDLQLNTASSLGRAALLLMSRGADVQAAYHSERVGNSLRSRRLAGKPYGKPAPGYKIEGPRGRKRLVPDEASQKLARRVQAFREGGYSWTSIYWHLLKNGIFRGNGREWTISSLQRLVRAVARYDATRAQRAADGAANAAGVE